MAAFEEGMLTAFPYTTLEQAGMPPVDDDEMGRVLVKPTDPEVWRADEWTRTTDELSGRDIEMRRADCGAGCRCATEVRFA